MNCSDRMCGANDCSLCHPEGYSIECSECEGKGKLNISNCCGVEFNDDIMMCPDCKEHCDFAECEECGGAGNLNSKAEKEEAYKEWQEMKAEEKRLDNDIPYEPRDREQFFSKNEL